MRITGIISKAVKHLRFSGGPFQCIVCGRRVKTFFPFSKDLENEAKSNGFPYDFQRMETLNYEQCNCPFCLSSDRERLYLIYLEQFIFINGSLLKVLDFAPTEAFAKNLRSRPDLQYTSADLNAPNVDVHVDICKMPELKSHEYDIIICSHVLEHVSSPAAALGELRRVLKKTGVLIVMVPLFLDVQEFVEDPNHNSDSLRLKYYGQRDHVRLYDRNTFLHQLSQAGFIVEQITPKAFLTDIVTKNAIATNSVLYVCRHRVVH